MDHQLISSKNKIFLMSFFWLLYAGFFYYCLENMGGESLDFVMKLQAVHFLITYLFLVVFSLMGLVKLNKKLESPVKSVVVYLLVIILAIFPFFEVVGVFLGIDGSGLCRLAGLPSLWMTRSCGYASKFIVNLLVIMVSAAVILVLIRLISIALARVLRE
ncbi:hypothetical protein [Paracidovorax oryzae]|uniref:hypothetical protein n=1 Tax=Paracidovorax oryzae TaxID=862720 RepID=UPI0012EB8DF4|nr:hypothetical protein [Paracidovorax oryzae]